MPLPIQTPDPGTTLKAAYGLKGRVDLALDEIIVPVHVLASEAVNEVAEYGAPAQSVPLQIRLSTTAPGAGLVQGIAIQQDDFFPTGEPVERRNIYIDRISMANGGGDFNWGIGMTTVPNNFGANFQLGRAHRPGADTNFFHSSRVLATGFRLTAGNWPGPRLGGAVLGGAATDDPIEVPVNVLLGHVAPGGGTLSWWKQLGAAHPNAPGNNVFWFVRDSAVNTALQLTIFATVLPVSNE